jgi:hypothetical protein
MTLNLCPCCAGIPFDEVLAADIDLIERHGWMIQFVSAPTPWAYTIGLTAGFAHPELTVVGLDYRTSMDVLNDLAEQVRTGARLRSGPASTASAAVELVEVHPGHWATDHFAMWWAVADEMGMVLESEPRALHALVEGAAPRRLDHGPNRATRRAAARRAQR